MSGLTKLQLEAKLKGANKRIEELESVPLVAKGIKITPWDAASMGVSLLLWAASVTPDAISFSICTVLAVLLLVFAVSRHKEVLLLWRIIASLFVVLVLGGAIGHKFYSDYQASVPHVLTEINIDAMPIDSGSGVWCYYVYDPPQNSPLEESQYPRGQLPGALGMAIRCSITNISSSPLSGVKVNLPISLGSLGLKVNVKPKPAPRWISLRDSIAPYSQFVFYVVAEGHYVVNMTAISEVKARLFFGSERSAVVLGESSQAASAFPFAALPIKGHPKIIQSASAYVRGSNP